jgi:hypothetical protein
MEAFQTAAAAKIPDQFDHVSGLSPPLTDSDKVLHRFHALILPTEVTLANRASHKFRDRGFLASRAGVQGIPEVIIKVQLRSPHDV